MFPSLLPFPSFLLLPASSERKELFVVDPKNKASFIKTNKQTN